MLIDCVNEDLLQVDEYVSDTKSIYSIVSYLDLDELKEDSSDEEKCEFMEGMLESIKKI